MQPRNEYLHPVFWTESESKNQFCSYKGDKVLIWRKKIKDGAMTRIFSRTFWKIDAS